MSSDKNPFEDKTGFHWRWPKIYITIKPLEERHFVTLAIFSLAAGMFLMAREDKELWDIELFKIILQAVVISGIIGMIMAFHFAATKNDEKKADNTTKAFEAIKETARATSAPADVKEAAAKAADEVATAADEAADKVKNTAEETAYDFERNR